MSNPVNVLVYGHHLTNDVEDGQVVGVIVRSDFDHYVEGVEQAMNRLDIPRDQEAGEDGSRSQIQVLVFPVDHVLSDSTP